MKKITVVLEITVDDSVLPKDIVLQVHDVIDGCELTRNSLGVDDDLCENFLIHDNRLISSEYSK